MALNPHQRKKVDISQMTEEEQKLFRLYGKLPPKKNVAKHNLMERKYFDSGDYALSKAGKTAPQSVGTAIPSPETIHHASLPANLTPTNSGGIPTGANNGPTQLNSDASFLEIDSDSLSSDPTPNSASKEAEPGEQTANIDSNTASSGEAQADPMPA
ncbi:uncharacterized protein MELLADRAFT_102471 [Melampsora larici-populina 98AG31]|uniref:mRNA stability protein n=1 Tax=Melampsora larici-populina (strain 98AG31 / pathotype 3-4-7) TaxID=747676 RepID=F4R8F3_MELLP|nr:uncharacterized protein MELLADRAFT_102471 [Melampsora larici-populina 98AG31]EGG11616.1 hypothetical protein MELLADRAFT_102471 [Melampsora larici-populina 98AG31]